MSQIVRTKNEKLNGKLKQMSDLVYCLITLLSNKRKHYSIHIERAINITVNTTTTGEKESIFYIDLNI